MNELHELGAVLRECRESLKLDIAQAAAALRIQQRYLEAIERGNFSLLPGSTYARGYIRRYAEYLRVDANDMLRRFDAGLPKPNTAEGQRPAPVAAPAAAPRMASRGVPGRPVNWFAPLAAAVAVAALVIWASGGSDTAPSAAIEDIPNQFKTLLEAKSGAEARLKQSCILVMDGSRPVYTDAYQRLAAPKLFRQKQGFSSRWNLAIE
jgi:cytoskeleton protein RodZ